MSRVTVADKSCRVAYWHWNAEVSWNHSRYFMQKKNPINSDRLWEGRRVSTHRAKDPF
jgi:hypothetical protein